MDKELQNLLEEIKDNTQDYVGTNGCLYQDLLREELNLLLDYIANLEQQVKKQKELIDKAIKEINDYEIYCEDNEGFTEYTDIEIDAIEPILIKIEDILKEGKND